MSPARRRIAVELPPELLNSSVHEVTLLKNVMYGTRDAAMFGDVEIASLLLASPRIIMNFYNKDNQLRVSVHCDDFTLWIHA